MSATKSNRANAAGIINVILLDKEDCGSLLQLLQLQNFTSCNVNLKSDQSSAEKTPHLTGSETRSTNVWSHDQSRQSVATPTVDSAASAYLVAVLKPRLFL